MKGEKSMNMVINGRIKMYILKFFDPASCLDNIRFEIWIIFRKAGDL